MTITALEAPMRVRGSNYSTLEIRFPRESVSTEESRIAKMEEVVGMVSATLDRFPPLEVPNQQYSNVSLTEVELALIRQRQLDVLMAVARKVQSRPNAMRYYCGIYAFGLFRFNLKMKYLSGLPSTGMEPHELRRLATHAADAWRVRE